MKKLLLTLSLVLVFAFSALGGITAFAEVSLEECDRCFQTTANTVLTEEEVGAATISATRKPVYDLNLTHLGYVYEFEIVSGKGYAIVVCEEFGYIANEFVKSGQSPYASLDETELCGYVNTMSYFKITDGVACDIATGEALPQELISLLSENAILYSASTASDTDTLSLKISYVKKDSNYNAVAYEYPEYSVSGGLTNCCAAKAGGNIVGYYDRFYEDLIPNHTAGFTTNGLYRYNLQDAYVQDTIVQLFSDMKGSNNGISEANFKSGLKTYCARKNLSCDYTSLMSSGKIDYSAFKSAIDDGKPSALFLSTYNTCVIYNLDDYDILDYTKYYDNHVMVGFGYDEVKYHRNDGSSISYKFIAVATGFGYPSSAYFNINFATNIDSVLKVYIH
ncbi:MAG: hypothetical protein K2K80_05260 [Clostridia bacterium]|nr:hypothetical protein [Clostridia bacterium]